MQIIKSPWQDMFIDMVRNTKRKLYLSSPFIKEDIAKLVVKNINSNVDCKILTKFTVPNIRAGGLDIGAIRSFNKVTSGIKNISNLHAKIFIFDDDVIVTSANLTNGGFFRNLEYGLLLKNKEIEKDFLNFYENKNYNLIKEKHLLKVEEFLKELPQLKSNVGSKSLDENDIFLEDYSNIKSKLSKGNLLVFNSINEIGKEVFTIRDIYKYKNLFNGETPENTIRRNLQELRDNGLLEFRGGGVYKKLWL